jgi:hypothetical protein
MIFALITILNLTTYFISIDYNKILLKDNIDKNINEKKNQYFGYSIKISEK